MTRILVTGGAGYIGSHVVRTLGELGHDILTIDNLSTGYSKSILYGKLAKIDLSDRLKLDAIIKDYKPEVVLHFAASVIVSESIDNPIKYYINNTLNTILLLEILAENGINNIVYSSTAAVYGTPQFVPISEHSDLNPINPYGLSKKLAEQYIIDYARILSNFNYVILRYFNVAGADRLSRIGQVTTSPTHLIARAMKVAKGELDHLDIFGNDYHTKDGTCIRDFIHVDDLAEAHIKAMEYLEAKKTNIFNCGYGHGYSVQEIVEYVNKIAQKEIKINLVSRREGDPAIVIADNTKIKSILNWKPKCDDIEYIIKTAWAWESSYK